MTTLFVFSPDIPEEFALAVFYVSTLRGSPERWDIVRSYWKMDAAKSEKWIVGLIKDNPFKNPFDSIGWWKTQIVGN